MLSDCNTQAHVYQAMLKEIVDETSIGKYDFMYLRIGTYPRLFDTL